MKNIPKTPTYKLFFLGQRAVLSFLFVFILLNVFATSAFANTSANTSASVLIPSSTPTPIPTSAPASAGPASAPVCSASKPGSAPSLLSAASGKNSVTLTWSKAASPVTKYLVAYGTTSGAMQYGNPSVGGADTTFYTVGSLSGGTTYYFKVKAINDCTPGDFSNVLSAVSTGAVTTTTGPAEGFAPVSEIPGNLFDIALTIDSAVLGKSSELIARIQFTSFGTLPTLVKMVYAVEDASGKEVFNEKAEITVQTEQLVTKEFKNLTLENGKYTLVLTTTYGNNVKDEFRQSFEVKGLSSNVTWIASISTIVGGFIIFLFIKRKQKR